LWLPGLESAQPGQARQGKKPQTRKTPLLKEWRSTVLHGSLASHVHPGWWSLPPHLVQACPAGWLASLAATLAELLLFLWLTGLEPGSRIDHWRSLNQQSLCRLYCCFFSADYGKHSIKIFAFW